MNYSRVVSVDKPTKSEGQNKRLRHFAAGTKLFVAFAALVSALAPAVMAQVNGYTFTGEIGPDASVDRGYLVWLPFAIVGVVLITDSVLSILALKRARFGRRRYNLILGAALLVLTWRGFESHPVLSSWTTWVFVGLFVAAVVMVIVSLAVSARSARQQPRNRRRTNLAVLQAP